MTETRTCKYEPCSKTFTPTHPRQIFCEPTCRSNQWYVDNPGKGRALVDGALRSVAGPEPTDCERIAAKLKTLGSRGLHSHEIRKLGFSGNPSQRITELEDQGYEIRHVREHVGRRPGTRYFLISEPGQKAAGVGAGSPSSCTDPGGQGSPSSATDRPRPPIDGEPAARLFGDESAAARHMRDDLAA